MHLILQLILMGIIAYLLGSLPTAVIVSRYFYKRDVRDYGSGNAGATNTLRVLGPKAALPVLFFDILKGFAAVKLHLFLNSSVLEPEAFMILKLALGYMAIIGHLFPVFAGFRGGKGVATLMGVIIAIHIPAALLVLGVFVITLVLTRLVSVSSMVAAMSFPVFMAFIYVRGEIPAILIAVLFPLTLIYTHRSNIRKLFEGTEDRLSFGKKD
ncbi:MAG: glycerol-3-phosphate 1-O-acyltransferase PlsY [Bacteroidia bacterium]